MEGVIRALHEIVAEDAPEGRIPSASIAIRVDGSLLLHHTAGLARLDPARPAVLDQPYDLASMTKPLAAATVAADLVQRGELRLDDPARRYAPALDPRITVAHLLCHSSGLPAWAPLYDRIARGDWGTDAARTMIVAATCATSPATAPGEAHCYSDLGFLALLAVLEHVGGARLDALLAPHARAAGVDLRWGWGCAAATEDCPIRGRTVEGTVHDPNADAMGGVSSHAGLFGTALGVSAFAAALLDAAQGRRDDLPGRGLAALWALRGPGTHRGGWDGISPSGSTTGRHWPPDGLGHLGYTGTSLWLAPRQRTVVALLTNRVHPTDDKRAIRAARPAVHEAVARALGWV